MAVEKKVIKEPIPEEFQKPIEKPEPKQYHQGYVVAAGRCIHNGIKGDPEKIIKEGTEVNPANFSDRDWADLVKDGTLVKQLIEG